MNKQLKEGRLIKLSMFAEEMERFFCNYLNWETEIEVEEGDECILINRGDLTVEITGIARKTLRGHDQDVKVEGWLATEWDYDPGVWYYPDGSGQPPSWDEGDSFENTSNALVLEWLAGKLVKQSVNAFYENLAFSRGEENESVLRRDSR